MSNDLESHLRQTMYAVADTTTIPPAPHPTVTKARMRDRFGRRITALIAVGGMSVIGVGAAAATGVLTPGAKAAFNGWEGINPRDAILVASLPGPDGTVVAAYEAPNHRNGQTCIAFALHRDPAYRGEGNVGGECSNVSDNDHGLGASGGSLSQIEFPAQPDFAIFVFSAGNATSAELDYDGATHAIAVGNGYVVGWAPDAAWPTATLIARDGTGSEIGEIRNAGSTDDEHPPQAVIPTSGP